MRRWAGVSAIAAALLFMVANFLWAFEMPNPDAAGRGLVTYFGDLSDRIAAGGLLSLLSIGIFVVFAAALRRLLEEQGHGLFGDIAFGGAILGGAAGLGAESINMAGAVRAGNGTLNEPLAMALFDISYVLGSYAAGIGFGLLALALGMAALKSPELLPRWLAFAAIALGGGLVTPVVAYAIGEYATGPAFLLVLYLGVRLLRGSAVASTA